MKLKRFEPHTPMATTKIDFLIERGGSTVRDTRDFVEIRRGDQIANIDVFGRVTWRRSPV